MRPFNRLLVGSLALLCAACAIGPDYVRPKMEVADSWKSAQATSNNAIDWQKGRPDDAALRHDWWTMFNDPVLDDLEKRSLAQNYSLQAAIAQVEQAKAQYGIQASALTPTVQLGAVADRQRISANRPLVDYTLPNASLAQNNLQPYVSASYEIDWLGQVRRSVEAARDTVEQAQANQENARLLLTAQVAQTYFLLRQADEEIQALTDSMALQDKVLALIATKHNLGASSQMDLSQQAALASSTRSQVEQLRAQRMVLEDSLATLVGEPANSFHLAVGKMPDYPPAVPLDVPSTLLERRPDIAAAERAMAAANAQIGVAKAAYFPLLNLSPSYAGYQAVSLPTLFSAPSLIWAIGVSATQTLFDGGKTSAGVDYANASYQLAVANYKQAALAGIQDAQDALARVQQLKLARDSEDNALKNQNQAYRLSFVRYKQGLDNVQALALVQQNQLTEIRTQAQLKGSQFTSTVGLIKALGGGWTAPVVTDVATPRQE